MPKATIAYDLDDEDDAEATGLILVKSMLMAGTALGIKMPIDGEYKIGNNWKETH